MEMRLILFAKSENKIVLQAGFQFGFSILS